MLRTTIAATAAALALMPGTALAADVKASDSSGEPQGLLLTYTAEAGEVNSPTFTEDATGGRVTDPTAVLTSEDGSCQISDDGHTATCADEEGVGRIAAELGDDDDTLVNDAETGNVPFLGLGARFDGGPGADTITGSAVSDDDIAGGAGDDVLDGRGGDDRLRDESGTNALAGGAGDDSLVGGSGPDEMRGEDGDDSLATLGNAGTDVLDGGPGEDFISRVATSATFSGGTAEIEGGPGIDTVSYTMVEPDDDPRRRGVTIRLDTGAPTTGNGADGQDDRISGVEDARGTRFADLLVGSSIANELDGGPGDDTIDGGAGRDNLTAGEDADAVDAQDGEGDYVRCAEESGGDPGDTAAVDDLDLLDRCPAEGAGTTTTATPPRQDGGGTDQPPPVPAPVVIREPVPFTPPADTTAPDLAGTTLGRTVKLATLRRRGYLVDVRSADAQPSQVVATLTGRTRGRARIAAVGDVIVAQRTRTFTGRTTFRLRPAGKLRRAIRRGSRLRLLVEVRDAAGNVSTRSVGVRVR